MEAEEKLKDLYCEWCPREEDCDEYLTLKEKRGCVSCGGFVDELKEACPQYEPVQGDEGRLLTKEEVVAAMKEANRSYNPSRTYYLVLNSDIELRALLEAQRDLTASILQRKVKLPENPHKHKAGASG